MAVADLTQHFEIEAGPLFQPLSLEQPCLGLELCQPHLELPLNPADRRFQLIPRCHIVGLRKHADSIQFLQAVPSEQVEAGDTFDLVVEVLHSVACLLVGRKDLEHIAASPEAPWKQVHRGPLVLHFDQLPHGRLHAVILADGEELEHSVEGLRRTEAVDA